MPAQKQYLAFDIGGSNGRCMLGSFDGDRLALDVHTRFENGPVRIRSHYYWDVVGLFNQVRLSLCKAGSGQKHNLASLGIDTWGTDFGLLDDQGDLLGNPFCYRDPQTAGMLERAFERMPREEIFQITGLQFMPINTLYHLLAMSERHSPALEQAERLLLIPDLLCYWLTGEARGEMTNHSTTQLFDTRARTWSLPLIRAMGLPEKIFPALIEAGTPLGLLLSDLAAESGLARLPVIATASHDTAAAVASVPSLAADFAYLSSGTWGLLGAEISEPRLDPKVMAYNFGNEGGVLRTIRLLRNIVNLWLLQECRRTWWLEGQDLSWEALISAAEQAEAFRACIDPDAPELVLPENMPRAIQAYCSRTGQPVPQSVGQIVRTCLESLAFKYRYTVDKLADILGHPPAVLHIVGGGAQNRLLCQMAANALGRPVEAGPVEVTALGNLLMQMIGTGDLASLSEGRQLIRASFPTQIYTPEAGQEWEERYHAFLKTTGLPEIPAPNGI
jgi:sugar (pentulose or hexulose) kinase